MLKFETDSRIYDSGDFIGNIINRSIGIGRKTETSPRNNQVKKKLITSQSLVPHNSVADFGKLMAAKVNKLADGPTDILSKGATIQCVNCGNMAKNLAYLENYIKSNGQLKKSTCSTCTTALSFLEYLNKNIETVFNNINSAGLFVLEQQSVAAPKVISEGNTTSSSFPKPALKKTPRTKRLPKSTSEITKAKAKVITSNLTNAGSTTKPLSKGVKGIKKTKPKITKNPSELDEGGSKVTKAKVKKVKIRPAKLKTKSDQSTLQK